VELFLFVMLLGMVGYHFQVLGKLEKKREAAAKYSTRDSANQLRFVMSADFHKKHIMSKAEYRVFKVVEGVVKTTSGGHRVFAQTSLGEVIGPDDQKAFESINSKRVDIMIIDPFGHPAAAIEYQGGGHYQGDAAARDAVKREALRKAGVAFIEIAAEEGEDAIRDKVAKSLRLHQPATAARI